MEQETQNLKEQKIQEENKDLTKEETNTQDLSSDNDSGFNELLRFIDDGKKTILEIKELANKLLKKADATKDVENILNVLNVKEQKLLEIEKKVSVLEKVLLEVEDEILKLDEMISSLNSKLKNKDFMRLFASVILHGNTEDVLRDIISEVRKRREVEDEIRKLLKETEKRLEDISSDISSKLVELKTETVSFFKQKASNVEKELKEAGEKERKKIEEMEDKVLKNFVRELEAVMSAYVDKGEDEGEGKGKEIIAKEVKEEGNVQETQKTQESQESRETVVVVSENKVFLFVLVAVNLLQLLVLCYLLFLLRGI